MIDTMTTAARKEGHKKAMQRLGRPKGKLYVKQLHLYVWGDLKKRVAALARADGKSVNEFCRNIIVEKIGGGK